MAQWPDDAPRGAVSTFCAEHGISRKSFYELRRRAQLHGPAAVLEPRSRRPASSPAKLTDDVKDQAVAVRAALAASGLDHGPISVHDKMTSMGLPVVPSTAALARILRERGVARAEPKKKPRSAWRRFVYPAPNACWQLDATEYVLTGGRKCVIFQLLDDHSRYAVASVVAASETSAAAIATFDKAVAAHGVPQRLLTDNGAALNPTRRGRIGQLVEHASRLGVEAITGKPYKPTTQGKNERFHQTLFRYLDQQPLAESLAELQAQVDAFDHVYNTQRPHQGLPGRVTPLTAWQATAKAQAPRPHFERPRHFQLPSGRPSRLPGSRPPRAASESGPSAVDSITETPVDMPMDLHVDTCLRTLTSAGTFMLDRVQYKVDGQYGFEKVLVTTDGDKIIVTDLQGEILIEHTRPGPGVKYVGNGRPAGRRRLDAVTVTDVLTYR
ncbi:IS481 family transposase [Kineococcus sp. NPDC059986]|uniref:IS481 family transposase n=1 Tax=Kineococcus sp. NPDC059986 TaxID=3155538 RepID=UPI0034505EA4